MDLPEWMTPDTVVIEPLAGAGPGGGPVYGAPVTTRARIDDGATVVRNAAGSRVTAAAVVFVPLDAVNALPPGSRLTVNGRPTEAITVARNAFNEATPNHWEVAVK